jgi:hypothetical protein
MPVYSCCPAKVIMPENYVPFVQTYVKDVPTNAPLLTAIPASIVPKNARLAPIPVVEWQLK